MNTLARPPCRKPWRVASVALATLVAVVGCANSSGSEPTTTDAPEQTRLTESEFVTEFGSACAAVGDELDSLPDPDSFEELAEQSAEAKQITADGVEDLRAIVPPEELQEAIDEILVLFQEYSDGFDALAEAARTEDEASLDIVVMEISRRQVELGEKLAEAGGIECGGLTS